MLGHTNNACVWRKARTSVLTCAFVSLLSFSASAQSLPEEDLEQAPQSAATNWDIILGGGAGGGTLYPGARAYHAYPFFFGSVTYRNFSFFGPAGLGANFLNRNGLRIGPVIGYQGGRDQKTDPHLTGLGNIQQSLNAGLFADYDVGPFEFSTTFRQAFIHSNNGLIGRARLDFHQPLFSKTIDLIIGPEVDFADGRFEKTWFGVSAAQSASSGLTAFDAPGGLTDVGGHLIVDYHYSKTVFLRLFGDFRRYVGVVSQSPIIESKSQGFVGLAVAYHWQD